MRERELVVIRRTGAVGVGPRVQLCLDWLAGTELKSQRSPFKLTHNPHRSATTQLSLVKSLRSQFDSGPVSRIFRRVYGQSFVTFRANGHGVSRNRTRLSVWKIKTAWALLTERGRCLEYPSFATGLSRQVSAMEGQQREDRD
jgi:hypothetical protein